jgi:phosphoribosylamine-glycine ligase
MKVGIIGSGGREHAIMCFIKKSKKVKNLLFSRKCWNSI